MTTHITHAMARPWLVTFAYATSTHPQGSLLSRHSTYALAAAAAKRSGFDSFLEIRDAR